MKATLAWCVIITIVLTGNWLIYDYVGIWTYVAISLSCGVVYMLVMRHQQRKDHELQMALARYAIKEEDTTITNLRKNGL